MDNLKRKLMIVVFFFVLSTCAWASGTITGTITYNGPLPHLKLIHMDADPICYAINKGNTHSSSIVVGDNNGLANVFVYIKTGLAKANYLPPDTVAVINQAGCNYSPHIMGVMAGQKVKFLNPDGTLHNVHAMCQINPEFNASMPDFRKEMVVTFDKPEFMFQLQCDVHPWMKAWIAVMPHPFFDVTRQDGKFEIKNVPAGTYTIEVWHEKLQGQTATVTVTDNATQKADFTLSQLKE